MSVNPSSHKRTGTKNGTSAESRGTSPALTEKRSLSTENDKGPTATLFEAGKLYVVKRNEAVVPYDEEKIVIAISKAYLAVEGGHASISSRVHESAEALAGQITASLERHHGGRAIHIEEIQDKVELALMRGGEHKVARSYVLYREEQTS